MGLSEAVSKTRVEKAVSKVKFSGTELSARGNYECKSPAAERRYTWEMNVPRKQGHGGLGRARSSSPGKESRFHGVPVDWIDLF